MDEGLVQRYVSRIDPGRTEVSTPEADPVEDLGCFGWLRGVRERAPMLELRKRSGNRLAINYSWIERIEYDPSVAITIVAGPTTIKLAGAQLNAEIRPGVRLFEGLTLHRVPWIKELSPTLHDAANATLVDAVTW